MNLGTSCSTLQVLKVTQHEKLSFKPESITFYLELPMKKRTKQNSNAYST